MDDIPKKCITTASTCRWQLITNSKNSLLHWLDFSLVSVLRLLNSSVDDKGFLHPNSISSHIIASK